jgi:hypothetical protein
MQAHSSPHKPILLCTSPFPMQQPIPHLYASLFLRNVLSTNSQLGQQRLVRAIYATSKNNYRARDYSVVMAIQAKLCQLKCLPTQGGAQVLDYISTWCVLYNQMEATGYPPSTHQTLTLFINGLPTNIVSYITLYDNVLIVTTLILNKYQQSSNSSVLTFKFKVQRQLRMPIARYCLSVEPVRVRSNVDS